MREEINTTAEECASKHSAHVIDVNIRGSNQKTVVEVFVDAETGITSELCSAISRDLADVLETRSLIRGSYHLVVSSPGIERPLRFPWQYRKHVGRHLRVQCNTGAGVIERNGKLLAADANGIELAVGADRVPIAFAMIQESVVQAPW